MSWPLRQRPSLLFLPLALWIFLFIFIQLFEVVVTLRVSFDALMNGLFSCDAQESGNYDSLSPSTFSVFLPPVVLLSSTLAPSLIFWPVLILLWLFSYAVVMFFFPILLACVCLLYHCFMFIITQLVVPCYKFLSPVTVVFLWLWFSFYNCMILQKYAGRHVVLIIFVWAGPHQWLVMIKSLWSERTKNGERCEIRRAIFCFNLVVGSYFQLIFGHF